MEPNYIQELIGRIIGLQNQEFNNDISSCDRPFLGPPISNNIYNTRPVQLYNAYTAEPWQFTFTSGDTEATSNIFRLENLENGAVTVRFLTPGTDAGTYTDTDTFATISLRTIGAIRCLPDTYISL